MYPRLRSRDRRPGLITDRGQRNVHDFPIEIVVRDDHLHTARADCFADDSASPHEVIEGADTVLPGSSLPAVRTIERAWRIRERLADARHERVEARRLLRWRGVGLDGSLHGTAL